MKRKLLIAALGFIAIIVIGIAIGWWYFFHTSAGVEFLLTRINSVKDMRVVVGKVEGTLASPLRIAHFELEDPHVRISADDIRLELTPAALWAGTIRASTIYVARTDVLVKPVLDTPATRPLRFLPSFMRISIGEGSIDQAHVVLPNGTPLDASHLKFDDGFSLTSSRLHAAGIEGEMPYLKAKGEFALTAQRPMGLETNAVVSIEPARSPHLQTHVRIGGNIDVMNVDAALSAPATASFQGELRRDQGVWRVEGDLASDAFTLEPWIKKPPFSLRDVALKVSGTIDRIEATGSVLVPEVDKKPLDVTLAGNYSQKILNVQQFTAQLNGTNSRAEAEGAIDLTGDKASLSARIAWQQLRWPLRGGDVLSPQGRATVKGDIPLAIELQADLALGKTTPANLNASLIVSDKALDVNRYALAVLRGNAKGGAHLGFTPEHPWRVSVDARQIHTEWFSTALPGVIDVRGQATGQGFDRKALFDVSLQTLQGRLRNVAVSARGGGGRSKDGWFARNLHAAYGENIVDLNGEFGQRNNLTWNLRAPNLQLISSQARGSLQSRGSIQGKAGAPHLRGELDADRLYFNDWHTDKLTAQVDIDIKDKGNADLRINARNLVIGLMNLDSVQVVGSGTEALHTVNLRATMPAESYEQVPQIEMHAQGGFVNVRPQELGWRGLVSALKFSDHYGRTPKIDLPDAALLVTSNRAQINQWCAIWTDKKLCTDAAWVRGGAWHAQVVSDELELNLFDPLLGEKTQLTGRFSINGQFSSAPKSATSLAGDGHVRVSDATVLYSAIENAQETVQVGSGQLDVNVSPQIVAAALHVVTPGTTSIDANVRIAPTVSAPIETAPLTGSFHARTSDANVLPLFFVDLDHAAGSLDAQINATGTVGAPLLQGRVQLKDGALDLYRYNLALRDYVATLDIADNRLQFVSGGRLGEGKLALNGALEWRQGKAVGELRLQGEQLLVADLPEYRVVASPNLLFSMDGRRIDATGDVLIPSAHIQPADLRGAVQRSPDARLVGMQPAEEKSQYQVHSDINVRLGDDVRLNTFGLQGQLAGAVTSVTHPGEPARGRGELRIESGRYKAYGQDLNIDRGKLLFDASPLDNPGIDILATRSIEEQRVGVNVRGTLRAPRMSFYAEPSLPQTQIVAYLLTGKPIEDMRTQDTAAVGNATDALALQGGGLLASQLGRRIGLEAVSVESRGLNDTSLVLGKFLSPRLFVSYGISLTESINTFKARYTISDRWLIKTEAGQYQSADVEFKIER